MGPTSSEVAVPAARPRRAGRRTNLALLLLLPLAFGSGWVAFGTGTLWPARVVVAVHAAAGIAVLVLVPWKRVIIRRGLRRRGSLLRKVPGVGLGVLVLLCLGSGLVHSWLGVYDYAGLSDMQVHVGTAVLGVPLFVAHVATRRQRPRATDLSRRSMLRLGGLLGAGAAAYATLSGLAAVAGLPGRRRRATGSYETGTDNPRAMPYVAWLFDDFPSIDPATFELSVRWAGGQRRVAAAELAAGADEVRAVLDCTSGWYAAQTWRGIRVDRLLPAPRDGQVIVVTSATGYQRRFPAAEAAGLWLAVAAAGEPLDAGHGAPVRLVAPGRRGFWWVKWVVSVELMHGYAWQQPPFPLQ